MSDGDVTSEGTRSCALTTHDLYNLDHACGLIARAFGVVNDN